ncbi:MAG TPA: helix-turn-helix domain-containing protein [Candidatus Paceibacterota bacterium]|nr:helix-turn-helix domain-containing protein [Candidatus Paceibacterota bacterium]
MSVQNKLRAIALRMEGYSYSEIMNQLPVSKSTLSGWLKHIQLTSQQEDLLRQKITARSTLGRAHAATTNRRKRAEREAMVLKRARDVFDLQQNDPFFCFGISMYWAEGGKKSSMFQFMNSDPRIIKLMIRWIETYMNASKEKDLFFRLYIHDAYAHENREEFWAKYLDISMGRFKKTIYKPTSHLVKRGPEYMGCMRIEAYNINFFYMVREWQNMLANKLSMR